MNTTRQTVLKSLRSLTPLRDCDYDEALTLAEAQATRLAQHVAQDPLSGDGVDLADIDALPRVRVVYEDLPVSGMSHWNGQEWIIAIAKHDAPARQRFTLLHEFKHIIDHGLTTRLYRDTRALSATDQAERTADYFAGCALVPKAALKRAWGSGLQRPEVLADVFGVSEHAIRVRLAQTGLDRAIDPVPAPRCARPISTPQRQPQRFRVYRPRRSYA